MDDDSRPGAGVGVVRSTHGKCCGQMGFRDLCWSLKIQESRYDGSDQENCPNSFRDQRSKENGVSFRRFEGVFGWQGYIHNSSSIQITSISWFDEGTCMLLFGNIFFLINLLFFRLCRVFYAAGKLSKCGTKRGLRLQEDLHGNHQHPFL